MEIGLASTAGNVGTGTPGSGGFMNPEVIVESFGLQTGMKVADFGSGAGYFTIIMAKKVGESGLVTAVDIMESALETVRAKASAVGIKNLQTTRGDLEVLGGSALPDQSQNMVLLANILFQSSKKENIIQEAKRVLVPGGLMIVIDWKKETSSPAGPPAELKIDKQELRGILEKEGFVFVRDIDAGTFHFGFIFKK